MSERDNPDDADDDQYDEDFEIALDEIKRMVMVDENHLRVDQNLLLQTDRARDEIVKLFPAIYYENFLILVFSVVQLKQLVQLLVN